MSCLTQPFVWLLAGLLLRRLSQQIAYLKAENALLRARLPSRIVVTPQEKQTLLRLGKPLGAALKGLISIVTFRTFCHWLRQQKEPARQARAPRPGRPRTSEDIQQLVIRLARDNCWGYTRILGELRKLGIHDVSRSTIRNILKAHGLDTGPKRGNGTWYDFIQRHLKTLWACDFFSVRVWTLKGVVEVYALFFIHLESRRVYLPAVSAHPNAAWVEQQARNLKMYLDEQGLSLQYLIHDLDSKFTQKFDAIIESEGAEVVAVGPRAPNLNAYAERFVLSIKSECLDQFVFFGEKHLRYVIKEYLAYYHEERPHQGVGNVPLSGQVEEPVAVVRLEDVVCRERLGGLLKHYSRAA
jgi:putative transposase